MLDKQSRCAALHDEQTSLEKSMKTVRIKRRLRALATSQGNIRP